MSSLPPGDPDHESASLRLARTYLDKHVHVVIDRPLGSLHPRHGFRYETNYGYVPGTLAPDGEELDAYYLGSPVPVTEADGTCVAIIHRVGDDDDKLVVADATCIPSDQQILAAVAFQEVAGPHKLVRA